MTSLEDMELHRVEPGRLLIERLDPARPDVVPGWFTDAPSGGVRIESNGRGSVVATMETKARRDSYVVAVSVVGIFEWSDRANSAFAHDVSLIEHWSAEETDAFARLAVRDLHPFLRSELLTLTSRFGADDAILLRPSPILGEPG